MLVERAVVQRHDSGSRVHVVVDGATASYGAAHPGAAIVGVLNHPGNDDLLRPDLDFGLSPGLFSPDAAKAPDHPEAVVDVRRRPLGVHLQHRNHLYPSSAFLSDGDEGPPPSVGLLVWNSADGTPKHDKIQVEHGVSSPL